MILLKTIRKRLFSWRGLQWSQIILFVASAILLSVLTIVRRPFQVTTLISAIWMWVIAFMYSYRILDDMRLEKKAIRLEAEAKQWRAKIEAQYKADAQRFELKVLEEMRKQRPPTEPWQNDENIS